MTPARRHAGWKDRDEGPTETDLNRFAQDDLDDFDDGLFPEERWAGAGPPRRLRWHNARLAAIAGVVIIAFILLIVW